MPGRLAARRLRVAELEQPRLSAGVEIDLQRVVVGPRDVQAPGLAHQTADAERFALQAGRIVGGEVPLARDAPAFGVQRQALEVALARRRHAVPPILADDGNPVTREVDGRGAARRLRRRAGALRQRRVAGADGGDERGDQGESSHHGLPLRSR